MFLFFFFGTAIFFGWWLVRCICFDWPKFYSPLQKLLREMGTSFRRNDFWDRFRWTSVAYDRFMVALNTIDQTSNEPKDHCIHCLYPFSLEFLKYGVISTHANRPFPSSPQPLYQNEVKCTTFDIEMIFNSHANHTHFRCALGLILKVRVFGTREWPISWIASLYVPL